jgi:hypothetical protein
MAIGQFSELKTAIANYLSRTDLTSRIPEFVSLAEDRIGLDLRVRAMEASVDLVIGKVRSDTTVGGTANVITLTMDTTVTSLTLGLTVSFTATATNTGATTVQVDATAATAVKKGDGSLALEASDIVNGSSYHLYYDGTVWRLGPQGSVVRCRPASCGCAGFTFRAITSDWTSFQRRRSGIAGRCGGDQPAEGVHHRGRPYRVRPGAGFGLLRQNPLLSEIRRAVGGRGYELGADPTPAGFTCTARCWRPRRIPATTPAS